MKHDVIGRSRALRQFVVGLAAGAVAVVLAGCAAAGASSPAPASTHATPGTVVHTVVRTVSVYDAAGRLLVPVTATATGSCFTGSITAPGARAYRCLAGNRILDPCFAPPTTTRADTLACLTDPWSSATRLRLTRAVGVQRAGGSRIWGLELAGGVRCVVATGTVPSVASVNLDYLCRDGSAATPIDIPAGGTVAHVVPARVGRPGGTTLHRADVRVMWRG